MTLIPVVGSLTPPSPHYLLVNAIQDYQPWTNTCRAFLTDSKP